MNIDKIISDTLKKIEELRSEQMERIDDISSKYKKETSFGEMNYNDFVRIEKIVKDYDQKIREMEEELDILIAKENGEEDNKKRIEDYIGYYIGYDNLIRCQSTDLINKYLSDLTDGLFTTYGNADNTHNVAYPHGWNVYKVNSTTRFRKGDIFVNIKSYGFNGIIVGPYDDTNVLVVSQNYNGLNGMRSKSRDEPVNIHKYPINEIHYIIRPKRETLEEVFDIDIKEDTTVRTNTVSLDLDTYNELIKKAQKYDELVENGDDSSTIKIRTELTMHSLEDLLNGEKLTKELTAKFKK